MNSEGIVEDRLLVSFMDAEDALEHHHHLCIYVPGGCTGLWQPLDVAIQHSGLDRYLLHVSDWFSSEVSVTHY